MRWLDELPCPTPLLPFARNGCCLRMDEISDTELLRRYATSGSDEAFGMLVRRYHGLVHGTAMRQLGIPHLADEVGHAVFLALSRKAGSLSGRTVLAGWLFKATRFAAAKLARDEQRRTRREQEAAMTYTQAMSEENDDQVWNSITPHLNQALDALSTKDRDALLLRFFEARPFAEVGRSLGVSEDAAKVRVGRAVEKLRGFFRKKGFVLGAAALASALSSKGCEVASEAAVKSLMANVAENGKVLVGTSELADSIGRHLFATWLKHWLAGAALILALATIIGLAGAKYGWFQRTADNPKSRAPTALPTQPWPQP